MPIAYPDADISNTNWSTTGGSLYTEIDEVSANDADFISTSFSGAVCEIRLSDVTDPGVHTGHSILYRGYYYIAVGGVSRNITVALIQGTTIIASFTQSMSTGTGIIDVTFSLTTTQAGNITDYTDLRIRLTNAVGPVIGGSEHRCMQLNFTVPSASGGAIKRKHHQGFFG